MRYHCPQGEIASAVSTLFRPELLRLSNEGLLFHPFRLAVKGSEEETLSSTKDMLALLESNTAQMVLEDMEEMEDGQFGLRWEGNLVHIPSLEDLDSLQV